MIKKCEYCKKEFTTSHIIMKFCSQKCYGLWQRKRVNRICLVCNKIFETIPSMVKKDCAKFCSFKCKILGSMGHRGYNKGLKHPREKGKNNPNWKGALIEKICPVCGKKFKVFRSKNTVHCSKSCAKKIKNPMHNCESVIKMLETKKNNGYCVSEETGKKISKANKGRKLTKEHIRKILQRRIPSTLEEEFQEIINKYNLPYKYVGDGKFFVDRFNPDFINTNSEKIAIEVYARYYKKRHTQDIEKWKQERAKIFKEYGWDIIYFDETQVKEDYVLSVLN